MDRGINEADWPVWLSGWVTGMKEVITLPVFC